MENLVTDSNTGYRVTGPRNQLWKNTYEGTLPGTTPFTAEAGNTVGTVLDMSIDPIGLVDPWANFSLTF